jgi:peptide/nickel transport system permease protein
VKGLLLVLLRRLLGIALVVWVVSLVSFALYRTGVASASAATNAQINAQLGPGEPASWQYAHYVLRLLHGNLGQSMTVGLPVDTVLSRALPPTLSLMIGAMILWLTAGFLIGTMSAVRPRSPTGKIVNGAAVGALVVPTFLLALLLLGVSTSLAVSGNLWMEPGYVPLTHSPGQWLGRMILPWIAVAATQTAVTAKLTRSTVLEVLSEDYIRTARAMGVAERHVFLRHVLRPASIPVIASAGAGFGVLLGYAAIVDWVFALGGVGQALLTAVKQGDVMVVMGVVLITAILISVINLIADICVAALNPQVRLT